MKLKLSILIVIAGASLPSFANNASFDIQQYLGVFTNTHEQSKDDVQIQQTETGLSIKTSKLETGLIPSSGHCFALANLPDDSLCFDDFVAGQFRMFNWYSAKGVSLGTRSNLHIVDNLTHLLKQHYIEESSVNAIIDELAKSNAKKQYSSEFDNHVLAKRLTKDLRKTNDDLHLYVVDKKQQKNQRKRRRVRLPVGATAEKVAQTNQSTQRIVRRPVMSNMLSHSEYKSKVLQGNVGYLSLNLFGAGEQNMEKLDDAMQAIKDTEALIIDLTNTRGGAGESVIKLSSYLFDKKTHLVNSKFSKDAATQPRWADPALAEFHYDKPVYVLTSKVTGSAAESFLFGLKNNNRITQVGQSTGGGGYQNRFFDLTENLQVSLSIGVTTNPETGKGWQSTGISPDVKVNEGDELANAMSLALK